MTVGVLVMVGVGVVVAVCVAVGVLLGEGVSVVLGESVGEGVMLGEAVAGRGDGVAALLVEQAASSRAASRSIIAGFARLILRGLLKSLRIGLLPEVYPPVGGIIKAHRPPCPYRYLT